MFISHYNHTEIMQDTYTMLEPGFDIELDVLFKAKEDTVIKFTSIGFEVPQKEEYWLDGTKYTVDSPIGCMNAWASYIRMPIRQLDSGEIYEPVPFETTEIRINAGESFWMSEIIPGYCAVELYRAVHLLGDFEIISGKCDVNIAALKSTGTVGNRSNFSPNAGFGIYKRDRQYKGISDCINRVTAKIDYTVDYNVYHGMPLPFKIFNNRYPEGNVTAMWRTHYNPSSETYDASQTDESNMLAFTYKDNSKLRYYGSNVKDEYKENVWYFDTRHNDLSEYINGCGSRLNFKPNTNDRYYGVGYDHCNLGNYGVYENYDFSMTNTTNAMRYANYNIWASANVIVVLYDKNGNVVPGYPICKGHTEYSQNDTMACIELPPQATTDFRLTVILPTNYNGDLGHNMVIKTEPYTVQTYTTQKQYIKKLHNHTGREFYKWEDNNLWFSADNENWQKTELDDRVKKLVYGRWKTFSVKYTGDGYVIRADKIGGIYFYTPQKLFREVYFLDENLKHTGTHEFSEYPEEFLKLKNTAYVNLSGVYKSSDGQSWTVFEDGTSMPVYNFSRFAAICKNKTISISADGSEFYEVKYEGNPPHYLDSYGKIYYCADGNKLMISYDGVYWDEFLCKNKIKNLYVNKNCVIINGKDSYPLPADTLTPVVIVDSKVIAYEQKPYIDGSTLMVPYEYTASILGRKKEQSAIPQDGYVPLREYALNCGYTVEWDENTSTAMLISQ